MSSPAGSASFSILLFQDIAAIPMIALVPLLAGAGSASHSQGWVGVAKLAGVFLSLVIAGCYLVNPIMRMIARTGLRELFTGFALLLVIGICLLMQSVGLSMALGTFVAGMLLADSEYRHQLESDVDPFKGLLLGLFFMAVGMSANFGVLRSDFVLVVGLVIALLVLKGALMYVLATWFDIPRSQRVFFALLMSQGGEFAFVIFGAAEGILGPRISSLLVMVVTLSMVMTPLLLLAYDVFLAPRLSGEKKSHKQQGPEEIESGNPVVIAGFGRFGQIIGRLLMANRIGVTVLDHDPDQIELLRRFKFKVYYGDATRLDLLTAAGIANAKVLVVAIDDVDSSLALVDAVRGRFPGLAILARARNVTHYYELLNRGVTLIERETFAASLQLGAQVLKSLGFDNDRAEQAAQIFREHNLKVLTEVHPHYQDQEKVISLTLKARRELEEMFAGDVAAFDTANNTNTVSSP